MIVTFADWQQGYARGANTVRARAICTVGKRRKEKKDLKKRGEKEEGKVVR